MRAILKFAVMTLIVTVAFVAVSALAPYSEGLRGAYQNGNDSALLFILFSNAWLCLAIWYIVKKSTWEGKRLTFSLIGVLFLVSSFMTQIETLFFHSAFPALTVADIFLIMVANGMPILVGVPVAMYLFGKDDDRGTMEQKAAFPPARELGAKLTMIGLAYVIVYFIFGYYIAWQSEELRVFYSGIAEDPGFFQQQLRNLEENPLIYPFQFFRGILFGIFALPLMLMLKSDSKKFLTGIVLVFLCTAAPLVIPNPLFPESVRWTHFVEMFTSMFFFAVIVWYVFDRVNFSFIKSRDGIKESSG